MIRSLVLATLVAALFAPGVSDAATAEQCSALAARDFGDVLDAPTRLTRTSTVPAVGAVPEYCRVEGFVAPQVGIEAHLPLANWNGKFVFQGCGAMCGSLQGLVSCPEALTRGYACATTDMGHQAPSQDGKWAYNNPIAEIDVGHRATHVATLAVKAILESFYGTGIKRSYFRGCSTGGRQALIEANRYPMDYDGIIGGAPVLYAPLGPPLQLFWDVVANLDSSGNTIMPVSKLPALAKAVMEACDTAGDNLKDGVIGDPRQCKFDPASLKCTGAATDECLTEAELGVVRKLYGGPASSKGRFKRISGLTFGTELSWGGNISGRDSPSYKWANENLRYLAFAIDPGPSYDVMQFDWDRDPQRLSYSHMTAANPDLEPFADNGGKLIMFHGWGDPAIPAAVTTGYYDLLTRTMGGAERTSAFAKLYLLPGMGHCAGGAGATFADLLGALDAWVEQGQAPDMITAYAVPRTGPMMAPEGFNGSNIAAAAPAYSRPLFPYPDQARYAGSGEVNAAASFRRVKAR